MSRRRYLSTKISLDAKINRLATQYGDFAALLYTWMIPHAEDDGTLPGNPEELLMMVIPGRRDKSADEVADALQAMHDLGLIIWTREGCPVIAFPESFYAYQTYIKEDRRGTAQTRNNAASSAPNSASRDESAQNSAKQRTSPQNVASVSVSVSSSVKLDGSDSKSIDNTFAASADAEPLSGDPVLPLEPEGYGENHANGNGRKPPSTPQAPRPPSSPKPKPEPKPRPRDPIWDTLVEQFFEPGTPSERNKFGKVVHDLKAANATPEQIRQRCANHAAMLVSGEIHWPLNTPTALASNWGALARTPKQKSNARAAPAPSFAPASDF